MYCTRLRAHRQPPGSPGRPQSGHFDGGPLACTSYAPQALEKMGCGQHQHLSTRTRELRAGGGLVSWVAAAAAAAAAVLCLQLAGLAAALLQLPLCPVAAGCWCVAVAAAASASASAASAACLCCLCLCCLCLCCCCPCCCLSFLLLPILLPAAPPSPPLLLLVLCFLALAAAVVLLLGRKGRFNANRQKCPRSPALIGSGALFWRALGQKEKRGSEEACGLPQANFRP